MSFPALFVGHGSPMNAIVSSEITETWSRLAEELPRPDAILVISAHWNEPYIAITNMKAPKTIHDFGKWAPEELFAKQYSAPGSPELAQRVSELLADSIQVQSSDEWGLDHGAWSVLVRMYPKADIPVVELCIDSGKSDEWHFEVGRKLAPLRKENILILASGSLVHNLDASRDVTSEPDLNGEDAYPWAREFNQFVLSHLDSRESSKTHPLVQWTRHPLALKSHPTPEHYQPILYILGLLHEQKSANITTYLEDIWDGPAIGMMSIKIST